MTYLVEVKNLKKNYSSKEAVKNISFNIKENEILGLLGPNGSGKTTTIGMLLGLLKPSAGEIKIDNMNFEKNRIDILSKINFISPYIELPKKLTIKQNLTVISNSLRKNLKAQMKEANKLNVSYVIILGDDEIKNNSAIIKDMDSGNQESVKLKNIEDFFKKLH